MLGLDVIEVMTPSGHLSNINEIVNKVLKKDIELFLFNFLFFLYFR